jgi:hypothetical protein
MRYVTIRNVPPDLARALGEEKARSGVSLNETVLRLLGRALGVARESTRSNGLRHLSGTWSDAELRELDEALTDTEHVDEELWR